MNGYGYSSVMCVSIFMKLTTISIYSQVIEGITKNDIWDEAKLPPILFVFAENECDFSAQDDMKKTCGDLCILEGKVQSSDFLDFVMSEVVSS